MIFSSVIASGGLGSMNPYTWISLVSSILTLLEQVVQKKCTASEAPLTDPEDQDFQSFLFEVVPNIEIPEEAIELLGLSRD